MKRIHLPLLGGELAGIDFGGQGPGLLLLPGLMGRASTWLESAAWLTVHFHVVGLDQRGHGLSSKPERAYTRDDYVNNAALAIEQPGGGPAVIHYDQPAAWRAVVEPFLLSLKNDA